MALKLVSNYHHNLCMMLSAANDSKLPGMDLGSGHELSIHSDAITIKLFRQIAIDEVYGVHWFTGESPNPESRREHRVDSHTDSHSDKTHSPQSKRDLIKEKFFPSVEESSAASERDYVKDRILPRSEDERRYSESDVNSANVSGARRPSRGDVEAEQRYDDVLLGLRQSNRLYQSRARVRISHGNGKDQTDESPDTRAAVCADLRNTRPPMSRPSGRIPVSKLIEIFDPITRLIDKVPSLLRVTLWLLSQSHPVTCPSICFSACGGYLGDELLSKLFRRHAADDKRIAELKSQVTNWLSSADIYLDFARLRGRGSVPLRTSNDIQVELRSADVIGTRINPRCEGQTSKEADDNTGRVAWLKGIDTSFTIPTCLLPSHAYLANLPESSHDDDTAPVAISIRSHLPAHFSESFLSFAATLSKTSQMLDIEEEAGLATDDTNSPVPRSERLEEEEEEHQSGTTDDYSKDAHSHNSHFQGFRAKLSHGRLGAAIKHPVQHGKHILHKEAKKTAVDRVDGAWFAKWTNKLLRQLEWLDGDVGYSMEVQTPLAR